tara:strand:+ start:8332 stop:9267 length:936 start_codon:yes stop_codon:yes gene_type:complete
MWTTVTPKGEYKMNEQVTETKSQDNQPPKAMVLKRQKYTNEEKRKREEEELAKLIEENKAKSSDSTEQVDNKSVEESDEKLSAEEKTFKKRYGDLRRHMQDKDKENKKQFEELKKQLEEATKKEIKLPSSEEEIEEWTKQYPDIASIVETIAIKKAKEQSDALEKRVKQIDEMQQNVSREKAETELLKYHPDFNEIKETDEFHDWAETQPKWVQDALYENENDARSAARAIDLYKADKGISKSKKSTSKDAAKSIATKGERNTPQADETKSFIKESDVQKMTANEYEKKADSIMEAIRSGKFIYDLSGSAR